MKPPEFQAITFLVEPCHWQDSIAKSLSSWQSSSKNKEPTWQDSIAKSLSSRQSSSENKEPTWQDSFAKSHPPLQTSSCEYKKSTWHGSFSSPLSTWQDTPDKKVSMSQDMLTKPHSSTQSCFTKPVSPWQDKPLTPWQGSFTKPLSPYQDNFTKPLFSWQESSLGHNEAKWEDISIKHHSPRLDLICDHKKFVWHDHFTNSLQDNSDNKDSTLQDILAMPLSPWQESSCEHKKFKWQNAFTKPLSPWQDYLVNKESFSQDIFTKPVSPWQDNAYKKDSVLPDIFTIPPSPWQGNSCDKEVMSLDTFTRSLFPLQDESDAKDESILQDIFTRPLSPWQDNSDTQVESILQDIFTRPLSPWQDNSDTKDESILLDIFTRPISPWQDNCDAQVESILNDIFTRPLSPWQDNPNTKEESISPDIFERLISPCQDDTCENKESTCQDSFTDSVSSWQVSACELKKTAEATDYPHIHMVKDTYLSAISLLPRNGLKQACDNKSPDQNTDLIKCIPTKSMIPSAAECLTSDLAMDTDTSSEVTSLINRNRRPLISSIYSRTHKEYDGSFGNVKEKQHEVDNLEGNVQTLRVRSLYRLDVASPLGQLVNRHLSNEQSPQTISNTEIHCLTSAPITSSEASRLRDRHVTYPITYRGTKGRFSSLHVHQYRFTRPQKVEFMSRVNTGLNKKSRILFKTIKPCTVKLSRLTKSDFKRWMVFPHTAIVKLKLLSLEEISYWTSPKADIGSICSSVLVSKSAQPPSQVQKGTGARTDSSSVIHGYNLNNLTEPEQIFLCENTAEKEDYESLVSEVVDYDNCVSKAENRPFFSPSKTFRVRKVPLSNLLPDLPIKKARLTEDVTTYRAFTRKCLACRRKLGSKKYSCSCDHPESFKLGRNKNERHKTGPVRSGIYNIRILTSEDGKLITSSLNDETSKKAVKML